MVKDLFPSRIYVASLGVRSQKEWNRELLEEIHKIQAADENGRRWSEKNYWGGYTSYGSWDQLDRMSSTFQDLEKRIRFHVARFAKALHWDVNPRHLRCNSLWANVMPQGTTHSFHIHPLSVISGTYYVSVPAKSSGLQFEDPRHALMMACPPRKAKAPAIEKAHYTHTPKVGEVVLFESWMRHQVPPNPVAQARVSVSFNYHWDREAAP